MSSIDDGLNQLLDLDGAKCAALVDYSSGMVLGSVGTGLDLEVAAGGNTEVVRAKMKTMQMLGLESTIEDILITLSDQIHLIRPLSSDRELFLYYVLGGSANLALARRKLKQIETDMIV
ncbi:MAG: hypothetical protein GYB41_16015 [Oceanospirillales bacterium]|uniref:Uncharacterized protein n=1 Tax=Marinobacterium halophilum TaxID=267374 RepID=A0A2P8ERW4_9GAMM|nr:hypothetical protein [Marinobacterium halophilum]MBR9830116.1 hypothetical protein [Oceanospirillales bacterium]PSL12194.1 hypothetical protein CLV44_11928 [Marinobacterium halophilum]